MLQMCGSASPPWIDGLNISNQAKQRFDLKVSLSGFLSQGFSLKGSTPQFLPHGFDRFKNQEKSFFPDQDSGEHLDYLPGSRS
jgi:hypothetical protein